MSDSAQDHQRKIAQNSERDLNTYAAKVGHGTSDTTIDSGVDAGVQNKFPGSDVKIGGSREIPPEEGGDIKSSGRVTKAEDFEGGIGGPEDRARKYAQEHGGEQDADSNTRRTAGDNKPEYDKHDKFMGKDMYGKTGTGAVHGRDE